MDVCKPHFFGGRSVYTQLLNPNLLEVILVYSYSAVLPKETSAAYVCAPRIIFNIGIS